MREGNLAALYPNITAIVKNKSGSQSRNSNGPLPMDIRVADYLLRAMGDMSLCKFAPRLGINKVSLSRILKAQPSIKLRTLQKLADALGVSPEQILQPRADEGEVYFAHMAKPGRERAR